MELADPAKKNPTEDSKDSELELDVKILVDNSSMNHQADTYKGSISNRSKPLTNYYKDIPIPPPDFS